MNRVALAPLPGEIDSIVRRVHRRRQADVAGALALSFAVLLGGATLFRGSGAQSLQPTAPSVTVAPSPSAAPSPSSAAPARRDPVRPPAVRPVRQAAPAARPAAAPATPSAASRPAKPPLTTGYLTRPSGMCDPSVVPGAFDGSPACLDLRVDSVPGVVTFHLSLCTYEGQTVQTLEFPTAQEADFVVRRDGAALWTWSAGQRFGPEGRTLQLSGDTCYRWSVAWDGTAEDGRALAPGAYTLHGTSLAEDNDGPRATDTTFTLE